MSRAGHQRTTTRGAGRKAVGRLSTSSLEMPRSPRVTFWWSSQDLVDRIVCLQQAAELRPARQDDLEDQGPRRRRRPRQRVIRGWRGRDGSAEAPPRVRRPHLLRLATGVFYAQGVKGTCCSSTGRRRARRPGRSGCGSMTSAPKSISVRDQLTEANGSGRVPCLPYNPANRHARKAQGGDVTRGSLA